MPQVNTQLKTPGQLLIPFAINILSGKYVSAGVSLRGKDCGCICPECKQPVVAKHYNKRRAHFAHLHEANCSATEESLIHKATKAAIEENGFLWLPPIDLESPRTRMALHQKRTKFNFNHSQIEPRLLVANGQTVIGPDILVEFDGRKLAIEVTYKHPTENEKILQYKALNLACIEIVVTTLTSDTAYEDLRRMLRDDALPNAWLFNRKIDVFLRNEEAKWKEINERIESERKREEIEKIKKSRELIQKHERRQADSWEAIRALKKAVRENMDAKPVSWLAAASGTDLVACVNDCPKLAKSHDIKAPANVEANCRKCQAFGGTAPSFTRKYNTVFCAGTYLNTLSLKQLVETSSDWGRY